MATPLVLSKHASLSKAILFEKPAVVYQMIQAGSDVNERDPYGLTPLIEATLKQDVAIAKALLDHGAKIDQEDISGQTALQWAVNRYLLPFCELFLKAGADPNHYSADGQPLLVNPLLRKQSSLTKLLQDYGAKTQVALDFISAKLMGHRYELKGQARIVNAKNYLVDLNLEGFYLEFTVGLLRQNLSDFMRSDSGAVFGMYAPVLTQVQLALSRAAHIIPYKYLKNAAEQHGQEIFETLNAPLVVIPVSYEGHAISFVRYGSYWAKCDRGVKHIVDTVVIYKVGKPHMLNPDFFKDLMFNTKSADYIKNTLPKLLDLEPVITLPAGYQLSGNCSWANVEASVPTMMFLLMFSGQWEARGEVSALKSSIMRFYDHWIEWDKDRSLIDCIADFKKATLERQTALATLLSLIVLQRCRASRKNEVIRAQKILTLLQLPHLSYILETTIKVYYTKIAGETGQNFIQLLKICGVKIQ